MKFQLRLEYLDKVYMSKEQEVNKETFEELERIIESASKGKANYFSFKNERQEYYFPENVLKNSIITIISSD